MRESPTGLGVAFDRAHPELVTAFDTVAADQSQLAEQRGTGERAVSRLAREALQLCQEQAKEFCGQALAEFAAQSVDRLFECARTAGSNDEQHAYYSGFRYLREARADLPRQFTKELLRRLAELADAPPARSPKRVPEVMDELALVDEREFEDWLNRSDAINRAESRFAASLEVFNRRLSYVVGRRLDERSNPLAPAIVCEILPAVLDLSKLERQPARLFHEIFGQTVMMRLGGLYERLNARLRERGILPDIEHERPQIQVSDPSSRLGPEMPDSDGRRRAETTPDIQSKPSPPAPPYSSQPGSTALPRGSSRPLPAARELLAVRNRLLHRETARFASALGAPAPSAQTFASSDVLAAVDHLHAALQEAPAAGADMSLMERVMRRLRSNDDKGTQEKQLAPETQGTVELLDSWFGALRDDRLNTHFLRDWSGRLAILALRGQLENGEFLREDPQPIHHLLNQLDRAGVALAVLRGAEQERLQRRLEQLLQRALAESRAHPEIVGESADEIAALIERPLGTRAINMQKVLQQCEGMQKLERAKRLVNQEIDQRIAEQTIPKLLLDFIDQSWRNLLVLVNLRAGADSDQWRRGLAVLDWLHARLIAKDAKAQPIAELDKMIRYIERELTAFGRYTSSIQLVVGEIRSYLSAAAEGRTAQPLALIKAQRSKAAEVALTAQIQPYWLGRAKLLSIGDWVFFAGKDGTPEPLRLQWIGEDGARFVFVNRSGIKAKDIGLAELAQLLEAASAGVAEDMDMPLTERQWQKKFQDLHDELVRFATHDPLTALLNRKALQKALERLPSGREAHDQWHALLYFALDGFKVINSTLGHEAGDELLQQVAHQLREMAGERGCIARMGGDEFAVLLEHCNANEAKALAEKQRLALYERRFTRADESLTVSASIGVVPFTLESRSPRELLKDADEACLAAKQAGGNQIHVLTPDDRELQQLRSSMERAAQVDKALETDKLRLRCQRIQPIATNDPSLRPFYEILISILGPANQIIPPKEFIPAAERFGRMTAVDRWVIREVLDWCARNSDALVVLDGFTINLCGPTLNDGGLARYLREQFDRTGVSGELLCFEVTETAAVQNLSRAADLIREVKDLGCRFSLDDFGSGLSSYSYLKNLPVDFLKVDGQFVRDIDRDEADHAMVRSINELGHFLGKRTIAEYVENDAILYQLKDIGLDFAQGYGIGHPMPIEELRSRL
ncbi:MAG TPA: DUF1631 family protein [Nitrococcus sp.]|nr:DUF1631 family protein [Nitrococcus sp.]